MATARTEKSHCVKCQKQKNTVKCGGCDKDFCLTHINEHHQELSVQLGQTEDEYNQFKSTLEDQGATLEKHPLIRQIKRWEQESIEKIRRVANEVRLEASTCIKDSIADLNLRLQRLTEKLIQCRREDDFADKDVQLFDAELRRLKTMLGTPPNRKLEYISTSFISQIRFIDGAPMPRSAHLDANTKWTQNAVTVAGGNGQGSALNQLNNPCSIFVDVDSTVYIADNKNHRILAWKQGETTGQVVAGGNGPGSRANQLRVPTDVIIDHRTDSLIISDGGNRRVVRWPRRNATSGETIISDIGCCGLAMNSDGALLVADYNRHEVKRYRIGEPDETIVAGGNGQGSRLNQLSCPTYIFVDRDGSLYVSDLNNHRVMKWMKDAKEGTVVAGGQGQGDDFTQLSNPYGLVVDGRGSVYVADYSNDRIIHWSERATEGTIVVGGNDGRNQTNRLSNPTSLSFDREGNLYVVDQENDRVRKFDIKRH